ncbi:hypothetical protein CP968_23555 [Streptomyces subrutilus]|uniref:Amino acid transporter n=1 Tax=Streptomyces subrutilus TaxID=36818 RepID=A0A5P2UR64_9ACTN|nr:hypothetical protein CP968_23555 [Streptomyces subrutilus]
MWRTLVAPCTAAVLLAVAICLVVSEVGLFTAASATVDTVLVSLVPAVFLIGLALAQRLKTRRPEVYARFAEEPAPADLPDLSDLPDTATQTTTTTGAGAGARTAPAPAPAPEGEHPPCPLPTPSSPEPASAPSTPSAPKPVR